MPATDPPPPLRPGTRVVTSGRPPREPGAPVNVPIEMSSTYVVRPGTVGYGRSENATWTAFEAALGDLEGGQALVFASGMAAISAAIALVDPTRPVVAPDTPYNTTSAALRELAAAGTDLRLVTMDDTPAVLAALDGAGSMWVESPTNPLMQVADLPAILGRAHELGVLSICDNTFATPLLQNPLSWGADIVVHSATKYLAGHSDILLGATVTRHDDTGRALAEQLAAYRTRHGSIAGPFETWLALRGLRTLQVRLDRAGASAATLAQRLADAPGVSRVHYPGFGAMLAIEVGNDASIADAVVERVRVWLGATSLGGVESLIERRRRYPGESDLVPENLLRLSVGIEDVEDLWSDLSGALSAALSGAALAATSGGTSDLPAATS